MRIKKIIEILNRKPGGLLTLLFTIAVAVLVVSMFNALNATIQDGHSRTTLIVLGELVVLAGFTLALFILIRKAGTEGRRRELRIALEDSASGFAITGLDGRFIEVNPALCDITGYSARELKQMTFQELTHPDDLEPDLAQVQGLLAYHRASYRLKKRYIHKNGNIVWIDLHVTMVRNKKNAPLYMIGQIDPTPAPNPAALPQEVYPSDLSSLLLRQPVFAAPLLSFA
jgi:PAS domain S-box-containing protein